MKQPYERLAWARERAGFESPRDAARAFQWNENTYKSHENGMRGFRYDAAVKYGRVFRVSPAWLMTGEGSPDRATVPIVGYIGAGTEIYPIDDHQKGGGLDETEAPPGVVSGVVAVKVAGDSMYPAYNDGDIIYYGQHATDIAECVGREAVVHLEDGRTLVKRIQLGSQPGFVTLISHNAPPISDVKPRWISRVLWVKRA